MKRRLGKRRLFTKQSKGTQGGGGLEIDAVTGAGMDYQRLSVAEQAQRVVPVSQRKSEIEDKQISVGQVSPNVTTSATYSPAFYAQAAQFQMYSQSGAVAAMFGSQMAPNPASALVTGKETRIEAVSSAAQGSRLDTQA